MTGLLLLLGHRSFAKTVAEFLNATAHVVDRFLGTCVEGVIPTPNIDVEFGGGGAGGHDHLSVANHLGVGVPGGMDVGLGHG